MLGAFLRECGYEVFVAETPERALALAQAGSIDAFLVSLEIASGDALSLCVDIRSMPGHERTPVFCVTDLQNPEMLQRAFSVGADDFIRKPIDLVSLSARLNAQLQKMDYFRRVERARRMMQRYLSPRVAMMVQEYSETGKVPPPEERNVSICFTDIRGFTALSELMAPEDLFASLSGHLGAQVDIVYQFGGYVDKFNGDGLMAIFDSQDHAERCCHCALAIMDNVVQGHSRSDKFPIGIGIHTGLVIIGNIGSPEHLDYSAVGPTVNLAARLSGYAEPETIMVSDAVRAALEGSTVLHCVEPRDVKIRGVNSLVKIFKLTRAALQAAGGLQAGARAML
jgi:class 3 adenylate cyclase